MENEQADKKGLDNVFGVADDDDIEDLLSWLARDNRAGTTSPLVDGRFIL